MKTKLSTRFLCLMLCVLMCVSLVPAEAFAEADFGDAVETTESEEAIDVTGPDDEAAETAVEDSPNDEFPVDEYTETETSTVEIPVSDDESAMEEPIRIEENVSNEAALATSGTCGDNLTWSLDTSTGVLTISGTGDMYSWSSNNSSYSPWNSSTQIKTVVIGKGVTSIGNQAFMWCPNLTSLQVSSTLTSIGRFAFYHCDGMTIMNIPDCITSVGDYAFSCCGSLQSVTIPASITDMGEYAFWDCDALTNINLQNSVISYGMFHDCDGLKQITIPDCVTKIDYYAFSQCDGLESAIIGDGVTSLGCHAFAECSSLKSVTVGKNVTDIYNYTFTDCDALTDITLLNSIIGAAWFYDCDGLESVTIPKNITDVYPDAFAHCDALTDINIEGEEIGSYMFADCASLTSVTIPDNVKWYGQYSFSNCDALTDITFENDYISSHMFADCDGLTSVTIPDNVTYVSYGAFSGCTSLTEINVESTNEYLSSMDGVLFNKSKTTLIEYPCGREGTDPISPDAAAANVVILEESTPDQITGNYNIPSDTTTIYRYAFEGNSKLTSVIVHAEVTSVGEKAFSECGHLKSVTFKGNAPDFGSDVFNGDNLTVYYPANDETWTDSIKQQYGANTIIWYCDNKINSASLTIPTLFGASTFPEMSDILLEAEHCSLQSITWHYVTEDGDTMLASGFAEAGKEYTAEIILQADSGYEFLADGVEVSESTAGLTESFTRDENDPSILKVVFHITAKAPFVLDQSTITVKPDDRGYIKCIVYNDSIGTIKWTSSNSKYVVKATALGSGRRVRLNGIKEGTATVTASINGYSVSCEVTVEYPKLTIDPATVTLKPDETLKVYCYYDGKIISSAHWETSDWTIVQVSGLTSGGAEELEAKRNGKATITATYEGKTATCEVSVESCKLTIDPATLTIDPNGTATVRCLADGKVVAADRWTSSDWSVVVTTGSYANVEGLRAVGGGKATITAYYDGLTATCQVSVEETRLKIDPAAVTVKPGESVEVRCLYNGKVVDASWSSTDIHTATVDSGGFGDSVDIEGVSNGKATIKAYYDGMTAVCQVSVESAKLTIKDQPLKYDTSDIFFQHIECEADGDYWGTIQWTSSQPGVIEIMGSGERITIEIMGPGTTTITASVDNLTTSCQATVTGDYTVTFDANNPYAYGAMYSITSETGSGEVLPDCGYISPGQKFTGWNTQRDGKGKTYAVGTKIDSMPCQEITLYAQWKDNVSYTLQYETEDGTVLSTKKVSYSDTVIIDLPDYTVPGYTVCGWKLQNGRVFTPGEVVSRLTTVNGEIGHLTVQLTEDENEQAYVASGTYGSNLGWTLDDEGTLTINGYGVMEETWCENYPWYAYRGSIRKVIIEDGVTSVSKQAFASYYQNLTTLSIGSTLDTIGELAFENSGLTAVTIPDCVEEMGSSAFADCVYLRSVAIGSGMSNIGEMAFGHCDRLATVTVSDENTAYCAADNVIFNKAVTTLVLYPAGITENTYEIPETVTAIADYAFFGANNLTSLSLGNSITSIGNYAFSNTGLTDITLGDSITQIGDYAFEQCRIGVIDIPAGVEFIGTDPFCSCGSLTAINVAAENEYYSSADGVLFNKLQTSVLRYPEGKADVSYEIPSGVTLIGEYAFRNADLKTVVIPNTVIRIADNAFDCCASLSGIVIPDSVSDICDSAFLDCASLQSITFGSALKSLGRDVFLNCPALGSVVFTGSAPYFDCWGVFTGDIITAYYPENDDTWTEDVMQDYGGTITWVAKNYSCVIKVGTDDESAAINVSLPLSTSTVNTEFLGDEVSEEIKQNITDKSSVSGVQLSTTASASEERLSNNGVQAVVDEAAAENESLNSALKAESENKTVSVEVNVIVTPENYSTDETETAYVINLTPVAVVSVSNDGSDPVSATVPVANEMLSGKPIMVKLYTGFCPAQIIHKDETGNLIEVFTGNTITYDEVTGICTFYISHFSTLTVNRKADPSYDQGTESDLSALSDIPLTVQSILTMAAGEQEQLQYSAEWETTGLVPAWHSENESIAYVDANGLVTALTAGTTYITSSLIANGTTYTSFCRVDVTGNPVAEEVTNSTGVIKVGLGQTAAAVNIYSTDYTELEIVPMLQQNMASLMDEEENTGAAVTAARFADPENGTNPLNELFTLRVKDDRTLVIVPKDGIPEEVYSKARTLAKSYTSRLIITIDDTEFETSALKLSISTSLPKLTAKTVKFNTADTQNAKTLNISGAVITGLSWKGDAPAGLELNGTTVALAAENAPTKSGKFSLMAEAEGWAVPIPVSVSFTVSRTAPTLKLTSTSLSVLSGSKDRASTTFTVSPTDFTSEKYSVQILSITETVGKTTQTVENGNGLTVTINGDKILVKARNAEAKTHTYTVSLAVINNTTSAKISKAVKLTVKVLAASSAVKVTPTASGSIDTAIKESPIKLTTKLSGFHAGSGETWSVRIEQYKAKTKTTAEIRNDVTDQNLFNVTGDNGNYVLTQADGAEIEKGYTYNVYVMVDIDGDGTVDATSKAVKLSVKWSSPAKVPVSVTLKASGSIDPLRPASTITLKPSFKNCYDYDISADDLVFIETVGKVKTTMTAADENCPFTVNIENGRYILQEKSMCAANTSAKYSVKFVHTVREGEAEVKSTAVALTVKAGKTVIEQSETSVSLIKADRNDTAIIRLTPANGQYAIDTSSVTLDSTSKKYYSLTDLGNGYYEIGFKDNAVNAKAKSLTAKITVKLQGAPATNKGTTVSVKINLVSVK